MSNPIRLTGLASGMDTDSIISQLMKLENNKVDKQYQTATKLTYKVDAYKSVNSKLKDFRLTLTSSLAGGMMNPNTYKTFNVNYKGTTNANNAVSVSAGSNAVKGDYRISVSNLATSYKLSGADMNDDKLSIGSALKDIEGATFTRVRVADVQSRDPNTNELMYVKDANGDQVMDENGKPIPVMEAKYENRMEIGIAVRDENGDIKKDAEGNDMIRYYSARDDESISTLINRVNADKETGVVMRYSQITGGFSFENRDTGVHQEFDVLASRFGTAADPYAWDNMTDAEKEAMPHGYYDVNPTEVPGKAGEVLGGTDNFFAAIGMGSATKTDAVNATVIVNGVEKTSKKNNISLDGMTFTLNDVTDGEEVKFTLSQNIDGPMDAIKGFVDSYNKVVEELNTLLTEKTYKDYQPLTDAQRKEMSETEQKDWDAKAKSGTLRRDSQLQGLLNDMRGLFYSEIAGTGMSMMSLGITTSSDFTSGGKLQIDETKLRKNLEENPDIVMHMFTNRSYNADTKTANAENGLMLRLQNTVNNYVKNNENNSLKLTEDNQKKATDKWMDLTDKLKEIEEKYYLKFAAMESAMSKMQSQMNSLSGFFQ